MASFVSSTSFLGFRGTARATVAIAATMLLLAGCSATPGASGPDSKPASPLGYEWTEVPYTAPLKPGTEYRAFSAGGTFWVYDRDAPTLLNGTTDGATWRTIDVTEFGVPADVGTGTSCGQIVVGDSVSATTTVFYHGYYGQGQADSITEHVWMVEITADEVTVSDGATSGLEVMPPREGRYAYRTGCVLGMETLGDTRVIVGDGQWWAPYATGPNNLFAAIEQGSGSWKVHASSSEPFFKEWLFPYRAVKAGDRVVVLTTNSEIESQLDSWSSTDGVTWEYAILPGPEYDKSEGYPSVFANEHGIAAWTSTRVGATTQSQLWVSKDALEWKRADLFDAGWTLSTVTIGENGFTAFAYRYDGTSGEFVSAVRNSADGVTWAEVKDDNPNPDRLADAIPYAGGLVLLLNDKLLVSGLPWGAP